MEYQHLFNTKSEHDAYYISDKYKEPWSAYIVDDKASTYNKLHDYSLDYLTTIARETGTISFNILSSMGTNYITSISFSTDKGKTWNTTANTDNKQQNLVITVNVEAGNKVLWKGTAEQTGFFVTNENGDGSFFSSTCEFDVRGNVMSLLYGDDFVGKKTLAQNGGILGYLFSDHMGVETCGVVDAEKMILPATTLATGCYQHMFDGCTSLEYVPELPATTLKNYCYYYMFSGCTSLMSAPVLHASTLALNCYQFMFYRCTSLTSAPELPATTLSGYCYSSMFRNCTSLKTAPKLPGTTLASRCYMSMFDGCTSLTAAPELPAITLAVNCYCTMFRDCTSLTSAPELPATTLAAGCCTSMFQGCTSLTSAPELPATTLAENCYYTMFQYCTSLTSAPELPATTLASQCYRAMFDGCSELNSITMLATDISATSCLTNWVRDVASTGTFTKAASMTSLPTGVNGIPSGWTVQDASA